MYLPNFPLLYTCTENEEVLIDFAQTHKEDFVPDGMTIDQNGTLYVATWGGSRILVINPDEKKIIKEITFPTAKITSVCILK